jgi:ATP-dependent Clp protease ATP-binding subunit ClpA
VWRGLGRDVPEVLRDRQLVAIDCALLAVLARFGDAVEVLEHLERSMARAKAGAILFLNRMHALWGVPDAAAPALLRAALLCGEAQFIGETTPEPYRQWLEHDDLHGSFEVIQVEPNTAEETAAVLRAVRADLERHHCLAIADEAVEAAARLAAGAAPALALPEAAVDLLDEAAGRASLRGQDHLAPQALEAVAAMRAGRSVPVAPPEG